MRLIWSQVPLHSSSPSAFAALQRSSNSLAIAGDKAYILGGEYAPRIPVDDELWVVDLTDGSIELASHTTTRPSPRVGAALVHDPTTNSLFLWGGREGADMSPCNSDLWRWSLSEKSWSAMPIEGDPIEERSFHVMVEAAGKLYLHAGCPAKGRLPDLHTISLFPATASSSTSSPSVTSLPSAPGPGRGGTVLCSVSLPSRIDSPRPLLVRYGGFAGYELGGPLDVYDIEATRWTSTVLPGREGDDDHPMARSVHAFVPVRPPISLQRDNTSSFLLAIMLFGERGPAPAHLGHHGAGAFHSDAFALIHTPSSVTESNSYGLSFQSLEQEGDKGELPDARGWFATGWWEKGGRVVIQGGLIDSNERLGDMWVGKIEV